jgi:heme-degrading monooxygenase HmoA
MYLTRVDVMVAVGRLADLEAWVKQYGDVLKAQRGFQAMVHGNSLGYPAKHTGIVRWESREAAVAWGRSPALQAFVKANPFEGLFTISQPAEAYEFVLGVGEPTAQARYGILVDWHIDALRPGNAAAFQRSRQRVFELRQQHGKGFVTSRLWRSLGNPSKYLVLNGYTSGADAQAAQEIPELQEIGRAYRWSDYTDTPPAIEAFEVIQAVI